MDKVEEFLVGHGRFDRVLNSFKGKRILVTGHTGFKGTWLVRLLNELECEVFGISDKFEISSLYSQISHSLSLEERFLDIRNKIAVREAIEQIQPDIIFHFAAKSLVRDSWLEPALTFETNIMGTINVLEGARNVSSIKVIAVATTDKVYKNVGGDKPFREDDELWGSEPYSASKVGTELVITTWRKIIASETMAELISLRAGNVVGGGDLSANRLIPDFVRAAQGGLPIEIRNGESTRPWQHVLDCLYGYLSVVSEALMGLDIQSINIGPAEDSLSVNQVIKIINEYWPKTIEIRNQNDENVIFKESKYLNLNSTLASSKANWSNQYSSTEAIRKAGEWWRAVLVQNIAASQVTSSQISDFLSGN